MNKLSKEKYFNYNSNKLLGVMRFDFYDGRLANQWNPRELIIELKQLLNDAEDKQFDMVISWKINRISRKLVDVLKIVDVLEQNNITFKSYSEPFETDTPAGKMQFQRCH